MLLVKSVTSLTECNPEGTHSFSPKTTPQPWKPWRFSALVTSVEDRLGVARDGKKEVDNVLEHYRTEILGRSE